MKQVLFCGFQREREPILAERKICGFRGLFSVAHQAKAVCVRDKKLSALSFRFAKKKKGKQKVLSL